MVAGNLRLGAGDSYIVEINGRDRNITKILNSRIFDEVKITITSHDFATVEYELMGLLIKKKIKSKTYRYFVGDDDLDKILTNCIGQKIVFVWDVIKEDDGRGYEEDRDQEEIINVQIVQ